MHGSDADRGVCRKCGLKPTENVPGPDNYGGIDPCLGGLIPGVSHVCCGHGDPGLAYVTLGGEPGQDLYTISRAIQFWSDDALVFIDMVKRNRNNTLGRNE